MEPEFRICAVTHAGALLAIWNLEKKILPGLQVSKQVSPTLLLHSPRAPLVGMLGRGQVTTASERFQNLILLILQAHV